MGSLGYWILYELVHRALGIEDKRAVPLDVERRVFRWNLFLRRKLEFQGHAVHRSSERWTIHVLSTPFVNGSNAE